MSVAHAPPHPYAAPACVSCAALCNCLCGCGACAGAGAGAGGSVCGCGGQADVRTAMVGLLVAVAPVLSADDRAALVLPAVAHLCSDDVASTRAAFASHFLRVRGRLPALVRRSRPLTRVHVHVQPCSSRSSCCCHSWRMRWVRTWPRPRWCRCWSCWCATPCQRFARRPRGTLPVGALPRGTAAYSGASWLRVG
jgi:hypothetical protein